MLSQQVLRQMLPAPVGAQVTLMIRVTEAQAFLYGRMAGPTLDRGRGTDTLVIGVTLERAIQEL